MSKQTGTSPTPSRPTPSATPVTGQLPPDFLRLQPAVTTVAAPVQYAVAPAYTTVVQQPVVVEPQPYAVLDILVKSAALLKSHSRFSKMDVYCVFSVGTEHRRTETHYNGDIAPVWGQIVSLPLYNTVQSDTLRVDVFDECMTGDDRFAWANIDNLQELLATGSSSTHHCAGGARCLWQHSCGSQPVCAARCADSSFRCTTHADPGHPASRSRCCYPTCATATAPAVCTDCS
eukprot:Colp12_sorted_trinity150504_noHs@15497